MIRELERAKNRTHSYRERKLKAKDEKNSGTHACSVHTRERECETLDCMPRFGLHAWQSRVGRVQLSLDDREEHIGITVCPLFTNTSISLGTPKIMCSTRLDLVTFV
jgi:hypothetical protein